MNCLLLSNSRPLIWFWSSPHNFFHQDRHFHFWEVQKVTFRIMLDWFQSSAEGAKQDVENTPKWVLVPQASFGLVIYLCLCVCPRWQKLSEKFAEKVLTRTKILSPNIRYFVAIIRFVAIYALFGNLWAKKCLFGSKTVFLHHQPPNVLQTHFLNILIKLVLLPYINLFFTASAFRNAVVPIKRKTISCKHSL